MPQLERFPGLKFTQILGAATERCRQFLESQAPDNVRVEPSFKAGKPLKQLPEDLDNLPSDSPVVHTFFIDFKFTIKAEYADEFEYYLDRIASWLKEKTTNSELADKVLKKLRMLFRVRARLIDVGSQMLSQNRLPLLHSQRRKSLLKQPTQDFIYLDELVNYINQGLQDNSPNRIDLSELFEVFDRNSAVTIDTLEALINSTYGVEVEFVFKRVQESQFGSNIDNEVRIYEFLGRNDRPTLCALKGISVDPDTNSRSDFTVMHNMQTLDMIPAEELFSRNSGIFANIFDELSEWHKLHVVHNDLHPRNVARSLEIAGSPIMFYDVEKGRILLGKEFADPRKYQADLITLPGNLLLLFRTYNQYGIITQADKRYCRDALGRYLAIAQEIDQELLGDFINHLRTLWDELASGEEF